MRSSLHHYSYRSLDDHVTRMTRYATLMASALHGGGRRVSLAGVLLRPAWRFVRGMVVKRGLLDGWRGLAFHLVEARYVREKYLRLWMLQHADDAKFAARDAQRPGHID